MAVPTTRTAGYKRVVLPPDMHVHVIGERGNYGRQTAVSGMARDARLGPVLPILTLRQAKANYGRMWPNGDGYRRAHSHRFGCGCRSGACAPVNGECRARAAAFAECERCQNRRDARENGNGQ